MALFGAMKGDELYRKQLELDQNQRDELYQKQLALYEMQIEEEERRIAVNKQDEEGRERAKEEYHRQQAVEGALLQSQVEDFERHVAHSIAFEQRSDRLQEDYEKALNQSIDNHARFAALLEKWEKQAERMDVILRKWEESAV